ncbi:hypothetical protein CKO42_10300 [Lamprobacter modestohalophilus]|uniref:Cytochrome c domain-containing protein n=2 Tax=Lamprobacter modestohalophilus TaxID=1064514 RepID=A0A9X0W8G5_9GAMM|nr:hypothetical protein [Lamprobacter modestohalophilus]
MSTLMFRTMPPRKRPSLGSALCALLLLATANAAFAETEGKSESEQAPMTGDAIYRYCQSCHGEQGAGGEAGKYPRIAGLPADYIDKQLHDFKAQRRVNKPMIPIFKHHRFDETVIDLVAEYIATMRPPELALWPYQPSEAALADYGSKQALASAGAERYQADCASCHGDDGDGSLGNGPPLIDQYPAYLSKQISDFAAGRREHAAAEQCGAPDAAESEALIFHLVELGKG